MVCKSHLESMLTVTVIRYPKSSMEWISAFGGQESNDFLLLCGLSGPFISSYSRSWQWHGTPGEKRAMSTAGESVWPWWKALCWDRLVHLPASSYPELWNLLRSKTRVDVDFGTPKKCRCHMTLSWSHPMIYYLRVYECRNRNFPNVFWVPTIRPWSSNMFLLPFFRDP